MADVEPISFDEAITSKVWGSAMEEELRSIETNHAWEMVELPYDKIPIGGWITKHKVRLVAKGFMQKEGINYLKKFSLLIALVS